MDDEKFVRAFKTNSILLSEELENELCNYIESTINYKNASIYYKLTSVVHLPKFVKVVLRYIEYCFSLFVETKNLLEMDYKFVAKILSSSNIDITSEIEIFDVGNNWLRYNVSDRLKYAKSILLKVRLSLLKQSELDYILYKFSSFGYNEECVNLINDIIRNKNVVDWKELNICTTGRYCEENKYSMLAFNKDFNSLNLIQLNDNEKQLKCVKEFPTLNVVPKYFRAIYLKGNIYVFGCILSKDRMSLDKYDLIIKTWEEDITFYGRKTHGFCACVFMNNIYILGGILLEEHSIRATRKSLKFHTQNEYLLKYIAPMKNIRVHAPCTVFEGRVVISGGEEDVMGSQLTNTVEIYDHIYDKWSYMPNMVEERSFHKLVSFKHKLYVIGGQSYSCEVYDNTCKKFVIMKPPPIHFNFTNTAGAVSMENKIIVFHKKLQLLAFYDITKDKWSEETYESYKSYNFNNCIKIPKMYQC